MYGASGIYLFLRVVKHGPPNTPNIRNVDFVQVHEQVPSNIQGRVYMEGGNNLFPRRASPMLLVLRATSSWQDRHNGRPTASVN